ncbi:MAG: OmpA family protein [Hyphomicrobium sp.]|nr:OmpA family protein [Hyphomicrobium sp.]
MSQETEELAKEIVIVKRRRGGGEEGHHGGAWKIAYADFMTAMMAFFLVMWLVNMTDDKTIVQVANYFNSIQLTDRNPSEKGLYEAHRKAPKPDQEGSEGENKLHSPGKARLDRASKLKAGTQEAKLFVDPQKMLRNVAEAALGTSPQAGPEDRLVGFEEDTMLSERLSNGPAFLDPFDPSLDNDREAANTYDALRAYENGQSTKQRQGVQAAAQNSGAGQTMDAVRTEKKSSSEAKTVERASESGVAGAASSIQKSILKAVEGVRHQIPDVSVEVTPEGVLVSLMDSQAFEMFKLGSAEPLPETVRLIDRIGQIIRDAKKRVVIRGHTDAKQFKLSSYDNWRLSTARAHMAHYMLRRAGIKDEQIDKIEGFGQSQLRNPKDPFAADNRRIEFLLRVGT